MSAQEYNKLTEASPDEPWLPAWAVNSEAEQWLKQKVFCKSWLEVMDPTDGREVLGPAKRWAYFCLGTLWAFFITFPGLALATRTCPQAGPADIPSWPKGVYFACLAVCLWMEWRCLRYAIARPATDFTLAHTCAPFKFLGFKLTYKKWLALSMFLSVLGHGSISTTGLFMAKAVATDLCPSAGAHHSIPGLWRETCMKSLLTRSLSVQVHFSTLVILAWAFMLLQPLSALLAVVPLSRKPQYTLDFFEPSNVDAMEYKTQFNAQQNHFTAVVVLADATRMACVADACSALVRYQGENDKSFMTLNALLAEIKRVVRTFALRSFTESAFQINLQVSFWVLEAAQAEQVIIDMAVASICFTILDATKTLGITYMKMLGLRRYLQRVANDMQVYAEMFDMPWYKGPKKEETPGFVEPASVLWSANFWFVGFIGITVLYGIAFAYAGVKLMMAFYCSDRIWELGCVELSS